MTSSCLESDIGEIVERLGPAADAFSGKTVLITGGRGFLGRYFTRVFSALNSRPGFAKCRVLALDNLITAGDAGRTEKDGPRIYLSRPYKTRGKLELPWRIFPPR